MPPIRAEARVLENRDEGGANRRLRLEVPGWPGAHSQGATVEELQANLREVVEMLLVDGEPQLEAEFVGTATVSVA